MELATGLCDSVRSKSALNMLWSLGEIVARGLWENVKVDVQEGIHVERKAAQHIATDYWLVSKLLINSDVATYKLVFWAASELGRLKTTESYYSKKSRKVD